MDAILFQSGLDYRSATLILLAFLLAVYIAYQRYWHPLSSYPGPFSASLTDAWQVKEWLSRKQPFRLTELHAKYGPVVRYGPDKISITSVEAIQKIYVKGSKTMPKTEFYDAFGNPQQPNIFNERSEINHTARRRILLKAFSPQAVQTYEPLINEHLHSMRVSIRRHCETKSAFDPKNIIYLFMCDVMATLICSQRRVEKPTANPFNLNNLDPTSESGKKLRNMITYFGWGKEAVDSRIDSIKRGVDLERKDVLTRMIQSTDPNKGEQQLTDMNVFAQAFSFIIAGVHPPSATTTMLFYNLLHYPDVLKDAVKEIAENLPQLGAKDDPYTAATVESSLPFLRNCIKENFRLTPVFTMPLARRVHEESEISIDGNYFPKGTSIAVYNYAYHHDPAIWGEDHLIFNPSRWNDDSMNELSKSLMHFGAGGRQCIGKVLATTLIYKVIATLLSEFSFELADPTEQQDAERGFYRGRVPGMVSVGISDLEGPLMVRARLRKAEM